MINGWIDAFINIPVAKEDRLVQRSPEVARWFASSPHLKAGGESMEDLIRDMDESGTELGLLLPRHGWHHPDTRPRGPLASSFGIPDALFDQFFEEGVEVVEKYPGRFKLTVMLDPNGGMTTVRQLERAVNQYGAIAARMMPAISGTAPDEPLCYPLYAKCIELGVPMCINTGVPGPTRLATLQRPMTLDPVLLAFPELVLVASHIGHPWHLETLALLQKHHNLYLMTSGFAPKYIPSEILQFMNTRGSHKVLWASDFPLITETRARDEAFNLDLRDGVVEKFLRDNAVETFGLGA